ncbi:hypothetical protein [uncultured Aquimarina sp.]|nr:hypothetical protein [uncultured Aquimarina sp.]
MQTNNDLKDEITTMNSSELIKNIPFKSSIKGKLFKLPSFEGTVGDGCL